MSHIGNEELNSAEHVTFDADLATTSASTNPVVGALTPDAVAPDVSPIVNFNILNDLDSIS